MLSRRRFVHKGAILIGTNEDVADPIENGKMLACFGALCWMPSSCFSWLVILLHSGNIEPSCGAWVMGKNLVRSALCSCRHVCCFVACYEVVLCPTDRDLFAVYDWAFLSCCLVVATATGRQPYFVGIHLFACSVVVADCSSTRQAESPELEVNIDQRAHLDDSMCFVVRRSLLRLRGWHCEDCVMVGDRMSTDIRGALEANIDSVLVLSGMTKESEIATFPFR
jgi:hypothetical protein